MQDDKIVCVDGLHVYEEVKSAEDELLHLRKVGVLPFYLVSKGIKRNALFLRASVVFYPQ